MVLQSTSERQTLYSTLRLPGPPFLHFCPESWMTRRQSRFETYPYQAPYLCILSTATPGGVARSTGSRKDNIFVLSMVLCRMNQKCLCICTLIDHQIFRCLRSFPYVSFSSLIGLRIGKMYHGHGSMQESASHEQSTSHSISQRWLLRYEDTLGCAVQLCLLLHPHLHLPYRSQALAIISRYGAHQSSHGLHCPQWHDFSWSGALDVCQRHHIFCQRGARRFESSGPPTHSLHPKILFSSREDLKFIRREHSCRLSGLPQRYVGSVSLHH